MLSNITHPYYTITDMIWSPQRPNKLFNLYTKENYQTPTPLNFYNARLNIKDINGYYSLDHIVNPGFIFHKFLQIFNSDYLTDHDFGVECNYGFSCDFNFSVSDNHNIFSIKDISQPFSSQIPVMCNYKKVNFYTLAQTSLNFETINIYDFFYVSGTSLLINEYFNFLLEKSTSRRTIPNLVSLSFKRAEIPDPTRIKYKDKMFSGNLNVPMEFVSPETLEQITQQLKKDKGIFNNPTTFKNFLESYSLPQYWKNWFWLLWQSYSNNLYSGHFSSGFFINSMEYSLKQISTTYMRRWGRKLIDEANSGHI